MSASEAASAMAGLTELFAGIVAFACVCCLIGAFVTEVGEMVGTQREARMRKTITLATPVASSLDAQIAESVVSIDGRRNGGAA